ncbi:hypothetical protein [Brevibacillus parabrevis]|uniref:hypothetical protein n=1 Tax=Brevibacillus parabrevis TaxID=54914 RepID=UPI001F60656F|nr:hypothetical protein [Brevibacillus parabrevis]MDR5001897.1 hypothetical protein [Brevibacillus parabrevis]
MTRKRSNATGTPWELSGFLFAQHFTRKQLYGGGADFIIKKINEKAQKNYFSK